MGEPINNGETGKTAPAYFATTLENFRQCAVVEGNKVFFDKSKEPKHKEPDQIQFVGERPMWALTLAMDRAKELNHSPAVLEGPVETDLLNKGELAKNERFPVEKVYVPRQGWDWKNNKNSWRDTRENPDRVWERVDVMDLLK